jgi:hypothetical protein
MRPIVNDKLDPPIEWHESTIILNDINEMLEKCGGVDNAVV